MTHPGLEYFGRFGVDEAMLRAALARAMHDATINQRLTGLGASIPPAAEITPARYATVIREETETSREAVRIGNIKLD